MEKCKVNISGQECNAEIVQENKHTAWVRLLEDLEHRKRVRKVSSVPEILDGLGITGHIDPKIGEAMDVMGKSTKLPERQTIPNKKVVKVHKTKNKFQKLGSGDETA